MDVLVDSEITVQLPAGEAGVVLLVNDSQMQLEAIRAILRRDRLFTLTADSAEQALSRMESVVPDLIISDVVMPGMDGVELCRRVKSNPVMRDVPVLLVSGLRYDDASVAEGFEAGADDYLEVNCLQGLLRSKVRRLISQRKERRALKEVEARYRSLVESLPAIVYVAEPAPPYSPIYVSPAIESLGYSREEWYAEPDLWLRLLHPDDRDRVLRETEAAMATTGENEYEYRVVTRDGSVRWVHDRGRFVSGPSGEPVCWQGVMVDITERKRSADELRRSEDRFQLMARATNDAVWDWDLITNSVWWNEGIQTLFGYGPDEVRLDADWWSEHIHPDDRERVVAGVNHAIDGGGQTWTGEYRYLRSDGSYAYVFDRGYVIRTEDGAPVRMVGAMIDLTERRLAEEALRESERRFRNLFDAAERQSRELSLLERVRTALARQMDLNALIRTVVEAIASTFGYTHVSIYLREGDELVSQHYVGYEQADPSRVLLRLPVTEGICGRVARTGEAVLVTSAGSNPDFIEVVDGTVSEVCVPLFDQGEVVGVLNVESTEGVALGEDDFGLMVALSEHIGIGLERARLYAEARQRSAVLESITDAVFAVDRQWRFTYLNRRAQVAVALFGRPPEGILKENLWEEFPTLLASPAAAQLHRAMSENVAVECEAFAPQVKRWYGIHAYPFLDGLSLHVRDITSRKEAEQALRESEEQHRLLFEKNPFPMWVYDTETFAFLAVNEAAVRHYGYSCEEFSRMTILDIRPREDVAAFVSEVAAHKQAREPALQRRHIKRDGTTIDVDVTAHDLSLGGKRARLVLAMDVTDRRLAEAALHASEQRFSKGFNASPVPISISLLENGCIVDVNESFTETTGYSRNELIGRTGSDLNLWVDPDDRDRLASALREGREVRDLEIAFRSKSGELRPHLLSAEVIELGGQQCILTATKDITDQKRAEEALRQQSEYQAALHETSLGLMNRLDLNDLLETIVARATALVGVPDGFIYLLEPDGEGMRIRVGIGLSKEFVGQTVKRGQGLAGRVWETGEPYLVDNYRRWPGRVQVPVYDDTEAVVGVPLKSGSRVVGVLGLECTNPDRKFGESEIDILNQFAQLASIALDNAQLYRSLEQQLSERTRAEEALRASEERFSKAFNASPLPMAIFTAEDRRYIDVNRAFLRSFGYTREEVIGRTTEEVGMWPARDSAANMQAMLTSGGIQNFEYSFRIKSGEIRSVLLSAEFLQLGGKLCVLGVANDITERKRTEEALRASEERFSKAFSASPIPMTISTVEDPRYLDVNDSFLRVSGYSREEVIGKTTDELNIWPNPEGAYELRQMLARSGRIYNHEFNVRIKSGELRSVLVSAELITLGGKPCLLSVAADITERKAFEEALKKSEREYRSLFDSANDPIFVFEPDQETILEVNKKACEIYGFTRQELIGMSMRRLTHDVEQGEQHIRATLSAGSSGDFESVHLRKDGTQIDVMGSGSVIEYRGRTAIMTIARDVTDIKRLQQQLIQSEKLAALGQLVSGVAHELNNPLTSVIGYTQLMLMTPEINAQTRQRLELVGREAERTRRIVQNLLSFSRQHKPSRSAVDLNDLIERTLELRAYDMRVRNISAETRMSELPRILVDEHQIQQVLLNIIVNAEQAMHSAGPGSLTIATAIEKAPTGDFVRIEISDTGPGMSQEVLKKLFDPFFTTKPIGQGTGLGLSIAYGIIREHGGTIRVQSEPGEGATFILELPALTE